MNNMQREPKIGIDALGIDTLGGGRTSILQLFKTIVRLEPYWRFVFYLSAYEADLDQSNVTQVILPLSKGILSRFLMQLFLPFDVLRRRLDIVHFTKSQASLLLFTKTVFTIHDVTILLHPDIHPKTSVLYWRMIQPFMARMMNAIVAVSKDGAKGIETLLKVNAEQITVVPNASQFDEEKDPDVKDFQNTQNRYKLPKKYMLVLGQVALKKNLATLIHAIKLLKNNNDLQGSLVMVGPRYSISDAGAVFDLISELGLEDDVLYLGALNRGDLKMVFKGADILLMPSIHEGFGIPCLEAMQLGVPVIASNASALPEIIGDAGVLVKDYLHPESWAKAIHKLNEEAGIKEDLIAKGKIRAKMFSWNNSAKILLSLYRKLLGINEDE